MRDLEGRIGIVTGASIEIGEMAAVRFASAGVTVIAAACTLGAERDPREETLAYAVAQILARRQGLSIPARCRQSAFARGLHGGGARSLRTRRHTGQQCPHIGERRKGVGVRRAVPPGLRGRSVRPARRDRARPALNMFTRALAAETQGTGVNANKVAPANSAITRVARRGIEAGTLSWDRFGVPGDAELMAEANLALCLVDPEISTGVTTSSGHYLAEIGREMRGRDGGPFEATVTLQSIHYDA